jgi:hypothetical protein
VKLSWQLTIIILVAIIAVTGLDMYAISQGIDGVALTGTIGLIAGIPTWFISKKIAEKKVTNGGK